MRTAIVVDTNSGIMPEEAARMGISLIPMPFLIDGKEYLEGEDCSQDFFFERMAAGAEVGTSQPSPGGIAELWERLLEENDAVLHFPMSSSLSGSCQTAKALALVVPALKGTLDGMAVRVPTPAISLVDLTCELEKPATAEEINAALKAAHDGALHDNMGYCDEPLVSIDFKGSTHGGVVDALSTQVMDGTMAKLIIWYDNESGFTNQLARLLRKVAASL